MSAAFRRPLSSVIPSYNRNGMLQLIVATGVCFVAYFFTAVCFQAFAHLRYEEALATINPYVALPPAGDFLPKFWTLFTYGWVQPGFFAWLSTAVWIYCWGSVVQSLVGHRQIIPLFIYGLVAGGAFCLAAQAIPGVGPVAYWLGAWAGLAALASAAFTLAPDFRFYLGPNLSIPIVVVLVIFAFLMVMNTGTHPALILSLVGGALAGYLYVRALQRGYRPGEWAYDAMGRVDRAMAPREARSRQAVRRVYPAVTRRGLSQRRVDELLEKIHQKGYSSLTDEEKAILVQASKESE